MLIKPAQARAYVNQGRWVADCPQLCGGALALAPAQTAFPCPECRAITAVEWPDDVDAIWEALAKRPVPNTRNWFPPDHHLAVRAGCPHGQSVKDLDGETYEHLGGGDGVDLTNDSSS